MPHSSHFFFFFFIFYFTTTLTADQSPAASSDAVSLLSFKSKADLHNLLLFSLHDDPHDYCQWQGVKCAQGRVVRFFLQNFPLRGVFASNTLSRLDQLRVLNLRNNSLFGPIPDLSSLFNLKSLVLDFNFFSASFPPSFFFLLRLRTLSLSHNNLSGFLPPNFDSFSGLITLRLDSNRFNGTLPSFNQSSLRIFNVSCNNFTGPIPFTPTLSRFQTASFLGNPGLCGEIIQKPCDDDDDDDPPPRSRIFGSPLGQNAESSQGTLISSYSPTNNKHHNNNNNNSKGLILGFTIGVSVLVASFLVVIALVRKQGSSTSRNPDSPKMSPSSAVLKTLDDVPPPAKKIEEIEGEAHHKNGNLVFCCGEVELYTVEQLMRASAELMGRGSIGTTYKAVMDGKYTVTVKRLDANRTFAITSSEVFERHMEMVGQLRHPNLVPIRAYFQADGERLVIFDYQSNGSLFNLIHGSRSTRTKPLHWTSCLKIAEDVAHGLAYIHQTSRLIHGNLKSCNVLLGPDFEARVTDYSLTLLSDTSSSDIDPDSTAYKAPETRNSSRLPTCKSDVYAFGVLLLEILTAKYPSQHPFLVPMDLQDWVREMRDDDGAEDKQLGMLTDVASICSAISPEQRPQMWQVLRMIQEIKQSAMIEGKFSVG